MLSLKNLLRRIYSCWSITLLNRIFKWGSNVHIPEHFIYANGQMTTFLKIYFVFYITGACYFERGAEAQNWTTTTPIPAGNNGETKEWSATTAAKDARPTICEDAAEPGRAGRQGQQTAAETMARAKNGGEWTKIMITFLNRPARTILCEHKNSSLFVE